MMDMEKAIINDVFLVTLFRHGRIAADDRAEVVERANEKASCSPLRVGRQQSEYLARDRPRVDTLRH